MGETMGNLHLVHTLYISHFDIFFPESNNLCLQWNTFHLVHKLLHNLNLIRNDFCSHTLRRFFQKNRIYVWLNQKCTQYQMNILHMFQRQHCICYLKIEYIHYFLYMEQWLTSQLVVRVKTTFRTKNNYPSADMVKIRQRFCEEIYSVRAPFLRFLFTC